MTSGKHREDAIPQRRVDHLDHLESPGGFYGWRRLL